MSFEVAFHIAMALAIPLFAVGGCLAFALAVALRWTWRQLSRPQPSRPQPSRPRRGRVG